MKIILCLAAAALLCGCNKPAATKDAQWEARLEINRTAIQAAREEILFEIQTSFLESNDQILADLTNSLSLVLDQPVYLKGRVYGSGAHSVGVRSSIGSIGSSGWWPTRENGRLIQGGMFELRNLSGNPAYGSSTYIEGLGYDPLPVVFTNDDGNLCVKMTYRFVPISK